VAQLKLDASWIDSAAREKVDLTFVVDESGSISHVNFQKSLNFIKSFLEYFSLASQHAQVWTIMVAAS